MNQVVGEIPRLPAQMQRAGLGELIVPFRWGLVHLHGNHFHLLPVPQGGREVQGNLELPHDVQDERHLLGRVRLFGHIAGERFCQRFPDGAVFQKTAAGGAENEAINAVGEPFGIQDVHFLKRVGVRIRYPQILKPVQHLLPQVLPDLEMIAPFPELLRQNVILLHILQFLFQAHPAPVPVHLLKAVRDFPQNILCQPPDALSCFRGGMERMEVFRIARPQRPLVDGHMRIHVHLVQHKEDRTIRRERLYRLHPAYGHIVNFRVVPALAHHHIDGVGCQETAVHGVHNLLPAKVQKPDGQGLAVQSKGSAVGVLAPLGHFYPVRGQGTWFECALYHALNEGAFSRRAVPQEDDLALVDAPLRICFRRPVLVVCLDDLPGLLEQGQVPLVQGDAS